MSNLPRLPAAFPDLQDLVEEWAIEGAAALNQIRLERNMAQIDAFYQRLVGRMDALLAHLQTLPGDTELNDADRTLYNLACAYMEMAPAVELFRDPDVPDGFPAEKFAILR